MYGQRAPRCLARSNKPLRLTMQTELRMVANQVAECSLRKGIESAYLEGPFAPKAVTSAHHPVLG